MRNEIQKSDFLSATITQFNAKLNSEPNNSINKPGTQHSYTHTEMNSSCMNEFIMHDENTHPGVFCFPSQEDLGELCRLYEGCIGQSINNASAAILEEYFDRMELALIREAIIRTGIYARRPGAPYIRAILKNWDGQGIHTMKDLSGKEETRSKAAAHQSAMQPWWQNRNYSERPTTPETYGAKSYSDPTKSLE